METRFAQVNDIAIAIVPGDELDAGTAADFKAALEPVLNTQKKWLIDLSALSFIDSSGLGVLLSTLRKVRDAGGELKLCGLTAPVRMVFEIVRMHRIFDIYNEQQDALEAFKGNAAIAA